MSEPTNYKQERLQKQIDWHSRKARDTKRRFRLFQIITLIASAIIPIINLGNIAKSDTADYQIRVISSIVGAIIVVVTGLTQLEKYQENWILYRTSAELLKKEKYFFENNAGEYSNLDEKERNKYWLKELNLLYQQRPPNTLQFTNHPTRTTKMPAKNNRVPSGWCISDLPTCQDGHVDIFSMIIPDRY